MLVFRGNMLTKDGKQKAEIYKEAFVTDAGDLGVTAANGILANGGDAIIDQIRNAG